MNENLVFGLLLLVPCVCGAGLLLFARQVKKRPGPARWGLLILGNALMLLFLLSIGFAAGEGYFRFVYDTTDSLDFTRVCQRWVERYWRVNTWHCRDDLSYAFRIQPGKRRGTFLGDSFTTRHGIKRIEDRFANRLRRAHPEWEIHVLARNGFDTGSEIAGLREVLAKGYQLQDVVLVYCLNDVADMQPEYSQMLAHVAAEVARAGWFRRNSYLADFVYCRYRAWRDPHMKDYYPFVRDAYRGPLWEQQKERLKFLRDLVRSQGGQLSVVTFPFLHALGPAYPWQFVHDELGQLWRDLNVPHLDLLPVFANLPPARLTVNRFDAHPNEFANQLAAEAIDRFLSATVQPASPAPGATEASRQHVLSYSATLGLTYVILRSADLQARDGINTNVAASNPVGFQDHSATASTAYYRALRLPSP